MSGRAEGIGKSIALAMSKKSVEKDIVFQIVYGNKYIITEAVPVKDEIYKKYPDARDKCIQLNNKVHVTLDRYMVKPVEIK